MKLLYSIFIIFITYCYGNDNILYEFSKNPENYQPSKSIQDIYVMENPQIISFNKIYKRHTNFALETSDNNKMLDFGQTFTFSPLDDLCDTNWEKNNAKLCFKYHPNNWNCIYDNCISLSRTIPYYIKIILPPIYYNNETTKQCLLLS